MHHMGTAWLRDTESDTHQAVGPLTGGSQCRRSDLYKEMACPLLAKQIHVLCITRAIVMSIPSFNLEFLHV